MIRTCLRAAAVAVLIAPSVSLADDIALPAASPLARTMQTVGVAEATIEYSSPGVKGREIFGGLVPLDELWRTGANAATKLTLSHDATVAGEKVEAGSYALFTIPGADEWVVILNGNPDQGGTGSYDEALDVLRTEVTPTEGPQRERMTFFFANTTDDATELTLSWDDTMVALPIRFETAAAAKANIASFQEHAAGELSGAARYLTETDPDSALELISASVALDETWMNVWVKADLLAKKGDHAAALPLAKRAWELGEKSPNFFWRARVKEALDSWPSK